MSVFHNNILAGASGATGASAFQIDRSLRFNDGDSPSLSRTVSQAGNRRTYTFSFWVKRSELGRDDLYKQGSDPYTMFLFRSDDVFGFDSHNGSLDFDVRTERKFRDLNAWMHIVLAVDTTQATNTNRVKLYVNGVQETLTPQSSGWPDQNYDTFINFTNPNNAVLGNNCNGYLAEFHHIDGQQLAASDFGEYDDNNVWQPKEFTGSYNTASSGSGIVYSSGVSSPDGTIAGSPNDATALFDGSLSTNCQTTTAGTTVRWTPPTTTTWSSSLRINTGAYSGSVVVRSGGTNYTLNSNGTQVASPYWLSHPNSSGTIEYIEAQGHIGAGVGYMKAIEIDGTILQDGTPAGVNGFYLKFADNSSNSALGTDSSGNSNTWTVNNLVAVDDVSTSAITNVGSTTGTVSYSDNNPQAYDSSNLTTFTTGRHSTTQTSIRHVKVSDLGTTGSILLEHVSGNNFYITGSNTTSNTNSSPLVHSNYDDFTIDSSFGYAYARIYAGGQGQITYDATVTGPSYPVLTTTNNNNYSSLAVGNSNAGGVSITAINSSTPSITVDGGSWSTGAVFTVPKGGDSVFDSPTNYDDGTNVGGNYATMNPLTRYAAALAEGNLEVTGNRANDWSLTIGTIGITSGKFYWEYTVNTVGSTQIGICQYPSNDKLGVDAKGYGYILGSGKIDHQNTDSNYGNSLAAGDVLGIAYDADGGNLYFYKNGTIQNSGTAAATSIASATWFPGISIYGNSSPGKGNFNFGQKPFTYSVPSGYSSLVTTNLSDPTIEDGSTAFDIDLYTGTNASLERSNFAFSPDLLWFKSRNAARTHALMDTVRGRAKALESQSNGAEYTSDVNRDLVSFDSDGFTVGQTQHFSSVNRSGDSIVVWGWDGGTSTVSNTDGSITSQVRANASAGFSIVGWTGTGATGSIGHGLNSKPQLVITKNRSDSSVWVVDAIGVVSSGTDYLLLNSTQAASSGGSTADNSVVNILQYNDRNGSGDPMIAYCFTSVDQYSQVGVYTGNGDADGPFIYTGFRPRFILRKQTNSAQHWHITDTARDPENAADSWLFPNLSDAEGSGDIDRHTDILSNGFKIRSAYTYHNQSGSSYLYLAFAEHPFKTARAR